MPSCRRNHSLEMNFLQILKKHTAADNQSRKLKTASEAGRAVRTDPNSVGGRGGGLLVTLDPLCGEDRVPYILIFYSYSGLQ